MKRVVIVLLLISLLNISSYSYAENPAPTNVTATEGTYSDTIVVTYVHGLQGGDDYEVWRDSYEWCEGAIPCEPEFIYWGYSSLLFFVDSGVPSGQVFEYRVKACFYDEITSENICSDFSLPAYGYVSEDAPTYAEVHPPPAINLSCADIGMDCGGGGGIFGDILKSSVIGYHLDGFTANGVQVYMPVTPGFKSLKGAQEYVRSFAPGLAEFVRKCFDYLEQKADSNKEGFLYNIGTHLFPILGKIAEKSLMFIGEQKYIDAAYLNSTISIEEYKRLEKDGQAIAPKVVKEMRNATQQKNSSEIVLVY